MQELLSVAHFSSLPDAVDHPDTPLYIDITQLHHLMARMAEQENENLELTSLEARVDELIRTVESLASENRALKSQHATLAGERALLIEKTEMARTRVEAMIARLKAMESRS